MKSKNRLKLRKLQNVKAFIKFKKLEIVSVSVHTQISHQSSHWKKNRPTCHRRCCDLAPQQQAIQEYAFHSKILQKVSDIKLKFTRYADNGFLLVIVALISYEIVIH